MDTLPRACKCAHTSIYASNLLVMRSVLSLEPRRREGLKERRIRDEKRGGQKETPAMCFPSGGIRGTGMSVYWFWPGPEQVWSAGASPRGTGGRCPKFCRQSRTCRGTESTLHYLKSSQPQCETGVRLVCVCVCVHFTPTFGQVGLNLEIKWHYFRLFQTCVEVSYNKSFNQKLETIFATSLSYLHMCREKTLFSCI